MTQKTVRVRIAVAMGGSGQWNSSGWSDRSPSDDDMAGIALDVIEDAAVVVHFIEADIPLPTSVTVEGEVVS